MTASPIHHVYHRPQQQQPKNTTHGSASYHSSIYTRGFADILLLVKVTIGVVAFVIVARVVVIIVYVSYTCVDVVTGFAVVVVVIFGVVYEVVICEIVKYL